jgi:hypothetical protein
VVMAETFELNAAGLGDVKQIPEYFYREFVPKDDTPPFALLPSFVPPPDPAAAPVELAPTPLPAPVSD